MNITLNNGECAVVDDADFEVVHEVGFASGLIWRGTIADTTWAAKPRSHTTYAISRLGGTLELRLHRVVMNATADQMIDHINGNGLDCRRANLRIASAGENSANRKKSKNQSTSRYKGVALQKATRKWSAHIRIDGIKKHLGTYETEAEAAIAYNIAATQAFGEFAKLNEICELALSMS